MLRFAAALLASVVASSCAGADAESSCTVEETEDGAVIRCPDGSKAKVEAGADGEDGASAQACTIEETEGARRLVCPDGTSADLETDEPVTCVGNFEADGEAGLLPLTPCTVVDGRLQLWSGEFDSLASLAGLQRVTGQVSVMNSSIGDAAQLPSLGRVGSLWIVQSAITTLASFSALVVFEGDGNGCTNLVVQENPSLAALGLREDLVSEAASCPDRVAIFGNPLLPTCEAEALVAQLGTTCDDCTGNAACP